MEPTFSYIYSIPYLIMILFFSYLVIWEYRKKENQQIKKRIRYICLLVFLVFFGLRGFVGYDWSVYFPMYESIKPLFSSDFSFIYLAVDTRQSSIDYIEPGYLIYISLLKFIYNDWHFFIFISTLIDLLILDFMFRKYSSNYAFSMLIFFALSISLEYDLLRNIKALMIFILSIQYIHERKLYKFLLLNLLAVTFHSSAILLIPMYWIGNHRFSKKTLLFLFVILNIIYLFQIPLAKIIIMPIAEMLGGVYLYKASIYFESDIYSIARGFSIGYIQRFLTCILIFLFYNNSIISDKKNRVFINMYIVYIIISLGFSDFSVFTDRAGSLFALSYWIVWPLLAVSFLYERNKKYFVYAIMFFCLLKTLDYSSNIMYKYENLLMGVSSYDQRMVIFDGHAKQIMEK